MLPSHSKAKALFAAGVVGLLCPGVDANSDAGNSTSNSTSPSFWGQAAECLQQIGGLTQLAQAISSFNSSSAMEEACPMLIKAAEGSANITLFAPTDNSFAYANITANLTSIANASSSDVANSSATNPSLAHTLCYHFLSGNFSNPTAPFYNQTVISAKYPNVTVGRTMLNDPKYVRLEANKSQILSWSSLYNKTTIWNQETNVTVSNVTKCPSLPNFIVATIDAVLRTPPVLTSLPDFAYINQTNGLSSLKSLLNGTDMSGTNINGTWLNTTTTSASAIPTAYDEEHDYHHFSNTGSITKTYHELNTSRGFTLFAPVNTAFQLADGTFRLLAWKPEGFHTLVQNHIINSSTVYSPALDQVTSNEGKYVSAAGKVYTFFANETGSYVQLGTDAADNAVEARLIKTDIPVANGVVHLIDRVLSQLEHDEDRAQRAYEKATAIAATQTAVETGVVGAPDSGAEPIEGNIVDGARPVLVSISGWVTVAIGLMMGMLLV